jgi:hypothetical protein
VCVCVRVCVGRAGGGRGEGGGGALVVVVVVVVVTCINGTDVRSFFHGGRIVHKLITVGRVVLQGLKTRLSALELRLRHLNLVVLFIEQLHDLNASLEDHHLLLDRHAHHLVGNETHVKERASASE